MLDLIPRSKSCPNLQVESVNLRVVYEGPGFTEWTEKQNRVEIEAKF